MEIEENEVTGLSVDFLPLAVLLPGLLGPGMAIFSIAFQWPHSSCVGSQLPLYIAFSKLCSVGCR